jgi:hypothetical protein
MDTMARMAQWNVMPIAKADKSDIIFWSMILLVALIVMFGVVTYIRKWMSAGESSTGTGFTLSDLRQLHKQGKMSTAEYESAKAILIGGMKKADAAKLEGPKTSPPAE